LVDLHQDEEGNETIRNHLHHTHLEIEMVEVVIEMQEMRREVVVVGEMVAHNHDLHD
jgi:hypothetical protein